MRVFVWVAVALLASAATQSAAAADDPEPLVIASTSTVDELAADYRYLTALPASNLQAFAGQFLVMTTGGSSLRGLDGTRPMGATISLRPSREFPFPWKPEVLGFIPVVDFMGLVDSLAAGGSAVHPQAGGVLALTTSFGPAVSLRELRGWALASASPDRLQSPPADPLVLLDDLPATYDLGARLFAAQLPSDLRVQWEGVLNSFSENVRRRRNEDAAAFRRRTERARDRLTVLRQSFADLEVLEVGIGVDSPRRTVSGDLVATSRPGSETARRVEAARGQIATRFAGFVRQDAAATFHFASGLGSDLGIQAVADLVPIELLRGEVDPRFEEMHAQLRQTLQEGRANAGLSLLGDGPFTLILGVSVVDAKRFGELLHEALREASRQGTFQNVGPVVDLAPHGDVRLSAISLSLPPGGGAWSDEGLFGSRDLEIVVGIDEGRQTVCLAVGPEGRRRLRRAIDQSQAGAPDPPPLLVSFRLRPFADLAAMSDPENSQLAALCAILRAGLDRIALWADHVENGYHLRLEVEEGAIRALMIALPEAGGVRHGPGNYRPPNRRPAGPDGSPQSLPGQMTPNRRPAGPDPARQAQGYLKIGEVFERRGDVDLAVKWYQKAVQLKGAGECGLEAQRRVERLRQRAEDIRRP